MLGACGEERFAGLTPSMGLMGIFKDGFWLVRSRVVGLGSGVKLSLRSCLELAEVELAPRCAKRRGRFQR